MGFFSVYPQIRQHQTSTLGRWWEITGGAPWGTRFSDEAIELVVPEAAMASNWSRWSTTRRPPGGEKPWNSWFLIPLVPYLKYLQVSSKDSIDLIQSNVFCRGFLVGKLPSLPFPRCCGWSLWGCPGIPARPRRRTSAGAPLSGAVFGTWK